MYENIGFSRPKELKGLKPTYKIHMFYPIEFYHVGNISYLSIKHWRIRNSKIESVKFFAKFNTPKSISDVNQIHNEMEIANKWNNSDWDLDSWYIFLIDYYSMLKNEIMTCWLKNDYE